MNHISSFKKTMLEYGFKTTIHHTFVYCLDVLLGKLYYNHIDVLDNVILFFSYPDYGDNSRALFEFMIENHLNKKYNIIWVISNKMTHKQLSELGINCVLQYSLFPRKNMHRYAYYAKCAKWVFHTHGHPITTSSVEQIFVNLWHGGMGFKANKDKLGKIPPPIMSKYTLISGNGDICYSVAYSFFNCDAKERYLPVGLPRNDLLFKSKAIPFIDSLHGQKILWMPTFRQSADNAISSNSLISETGLPIIYSGFQLVKLNDFLRNVNVHLYIKIHPLQKLELICKEDSSNIHFLTNEDLDNNNVQLYEIMNHFDALITDYSSVSFDYMYLNRPIGYTLDDFKDYERLRGFAMPNPLNYMPGPHLYTYEDFEKFIIGISENKDNYESERKRVMMDVGMPQGNENCKRLLEYLGIM